MHGKWQNSFEIASVRAGGRQLHISQGRQGAQCCVAITDSRTHVVLVQQFENFNTYAAAL